VTALYPWLPPHLVDVFADNWADTGDAALALAQTRGDPTYAEYFPGIKRSDGSLRMSEQEWFSTREAYTRLFSEFGINGAVFDGRFTELMEGDVSPAELAGRLGGAYEQILTNIPEVRSEFSRLYGVDMTDEAIFSWFIDPTVGDALVSRKISVAQISGESVARGFTPDEAFASRLEAGGVDQAAARQFFSEAEDVVPTLDQLARRFRDPDPTFDVEELAEASIFGSAGQGRRMRRLLASETSLYSDRLGSIATDEDLRISGLSAR
jgi:hypothetical protein